MTTHTTDILPGGLQVHTVTSVGTSAGAEVRVFDLGQQGGTRSWAFGSFWRGWPLTHGTLTAPSLRQAVRTIVEEAIDISPSAHATRTLRSLAGLPLEIAA